MCNSIITEDPFSIRNGPDKYKTQHMYDKAVDNCLAALKWLKNFLLLCMQMKINLL